MSRVHNARGAARASSARAPQTKAPASTRDPTPAATAAHAGAPTPAPPLDGLSLQQLRVLAALVEDPSVTRAAGRLGVTPSAVSHSLRALRAALGDPLLVRSGAGLLPTPRAAALAVPLRRSLAELEAALRGAGPGFEPGTSTRLLTVAMSDALVLTVLPLLVGRLQREAPGIDLHVVPNARDAASALESGGCDLELRVDRPADARLQVRALYRDEMICAVRHDHPRVGAQLDIDTFCALPHALMSPTGDGRGIVDVALGALARARRVQLRTRYFVGAPWVVLDSDLIVTGPRTMLEQVARRLPLRLYPPPLELPDFTVHLVWHKRDQEDPSHRWARELVVAVTRGFAAPARARR